MKDIEENNKLIAEFMGLGCQLGMFEHPENGEYISLDEAEYNSSWDWIMPCYEKLHKLGFKYSIDPENVLIWYATSNTQKGIMHNSMIDAAYYSLLEFIEWYNKEQN